MSMVTTFGGKPHTQRIRWEHVVNAFTPKLFRRGVWTVVVLFGLLYTAGREDDLV